MALEAHRYPLRFELASSALKPHLHDWLMSSWPAEAWAIGDYATDVMHSLVRLGTQAEQYLGGVAIGWDGPVETSPLGMVVRNGDGLTVRQLHSLEVPNDQWRGDALIPPDGDKFDVFIPANPPRPDATLEAALGDLRPGRTVAERLLWVRRRQEVLLRQLHHLVDENRQLLAEVDEGKQTIAQLQATIEQLTAEASREVDPRRSYSLVGFAGNVLSFAGGALSVWAASKGLDGGSAVEAVDAAGRQVNEAWRTCLEIRGELGGYDTDPPIPYAPSEP